MKFHYDEKKLIFNPHVSKFDGFTLKLSIDFRVKFYKEWRHCRTSLYLRDISSLYFQGDLSQFFTLVKVFNGKSLL